MDESFYAFPISSKTPGKKLRSWNENPEKSHGYAGGVRQEEEFMVAWPLSIKIIPPNPFKYQYDMLFLSVLGGPRLTEKSY